MTPEQFCYWLQGKFEGRKLADLPKAEVKEIQKHLDLVFTHSKPKVTSTLDESLRRSTVVGPRMDMHSSTLIC